MCEIPWRDAGMVFAARPRGIRYLGSNVRPEPAELLETLADGRKVSKRPKASSSWIEPACR
ncbi:hypothetical protein [Streptomyces sp. NPDC002205]|uniref:hypothetical protein n=1 Tax=Streptomyces sp. NPDC002205 TaxID=3154411 RepID=UPI00332743F1